jgi:molybdopterin/thiamine biosynthesis adenylyltransferase
MFSYDEAFSRNLGWVTAEEQATLRRKRVAIAGLGGTGGIHVLTLARLGVGAFNIADFDTFGLANFNRQAGAMVSTLGRAKIEVLDEMARDINPELTIHKFAGGVTEDNVDQFLEGVDIYVDALDYFAFEARDLVYRKLEEKRIPAVIAAPLGMGTAIVNFLPGRMTFEEYFQLRGLPPKEKALHFLIGLSPALLQRTYLVDPDRVKFGERAGPSTGMACQMCAGAAGVEVLKILLGRGRVLSAPHGFQFDAYRNKFIRTWRPGGMSNPLMKLMLMLAKMKLKMDVRRGG